MDGQQWGQERKVWMWPWEDTRPRERRWTAV